VYSSFGRGTLEAAAATATAATETASVSLGWADR
jgi:hypothetical protein